MAKDPAFLFYSQDFFLGSATMTFEDKGKYIHILCLMHQQGRLDEETIRFSVGNVSVKLKSKFRIDENGFWFNERLESETEKRNKFTKSRRDNGSMGGRPKKQKTDRLSVGLPTDNHMGNANEDYSIDTIVLYNNSLSKYLKDEFEERKVTDVQEQKYFDMVVKDMNSIWMKYKPAYSFLQEVDYPALLRIAYLIASRKGIRKYDAVHGSQDEITKSFEKIAEFMANTDSKFFKKLALSGIANPKNFQSIEEEMRTLKQTDKQQQLEQDRILPENYFTN